MQQVDPTLRLNRICFGPHALCQWDKITDGGPGPYDGVAAVDPRTGLLVAAWGDDQAAYMDWVSDYRFEWETIVSWKNLSLAKKLIPFSLDLPLEDGAYITQLPDELDIGTKGLKGRNAQGRAKHGAPAILVQDDGVQELLQSYYGARRYRRHFT